MGLDSVDEEAFSRWGQVASATDMFARFAHAVASKITFWR
jgi:hypothetical protein